MAKYVEWSDALSVGIEEIDSQHKILVGMLNDMHEAIQEHRGSNAVRDILRKLGDYTRIHFAVEESLMRILGYPGYDDHKVQHEELIQSLHDLQRKVEASKSGIGFELMHFLKVWLTKHILESDQQYAEFFIQAGAQPRLKKKSWASRIWDHLHA